MKPQQKYARQMLAAAMLTGLFSGTTVLADYQADVLAQGPVGYWRLNETTVPQAPITNAANLGSLGSAQDAVYDGDQAFFRGASGALASGDTAVQFDGTAQLVYAPYSPALNPAANFTVEAWLAPATLAPSGGSACAIASGNFASPRSGWLLYQSTTGWNFRMYNQNALNTSLNITANTNMVVGTFYHVVVTFDGTTASLYVNGVMLKSGAPTGYVPSVNGELTIGSRSDGAFLWTGKADEVAVYGSVLPASEIVAHYEAASTNAAGYATQILASSPLVYYRFNEAGDPVAANIGSYLAEANGVYVYSAKPGQAGPTVANMGVGNKATQFDGSGGSVTLPPMPLSGNEVTLTAWVKPTGSQANSAGIVFNTAKSSGLRMGSAGGYELSYDWNGTSGSFVSGLNLVDSQWSFVGLIIRPDKAILCLQDGTTFSTAENIFVNESASWGSKSSIGNAGEAAVFNGSIDEVTLFDRALGIGDVYSQYAAAVGGLGPRIFVEPQAPATTVYQFDAITLAVDAGGTPVLTYQWRKGLQPIDGATNRTYVIASAQAANSGSYDVIITNPYGTATSQAVTIAVTDLTAPAITQEPVGRSLYEGGTIDLEVVASGGGLRYQWSKDGQPIEGATNAIYRVESAAAADTGSYAVGITNAIGPAVVSASVTVTVIAPAAGTFEALVVEDQPQAWWRLNEPAGAVTATDSMGRHDGAVNGAITYGVPGAVTTSAGNTAASFDGNSYIRVPYASALNPAVYSIECWAKVPDLENYCVVSSISVASSSSPYKGKGYMVTSDGGSWRACTGHDDQYAYYYSALGSVVPGEWAHAVMTYDGTSGQVYYLNGVRVPETGGYGDFVRNVTADLLIGAAGPGIGVLSVPFKGEIDEVALYATALSQARVQAHYAAALYGTNVAPIFKTQPVSTTVKLHSSITLRVVAEGSVPISYQWLKDGAPLTGKTNASLALNNLEYTNAGNYSALAMNLVGTNTSATAKVEVLTDTPQAINATNDLVLHLKFEDDYTDASGRGHNGTDVGGTSFVPGKVGKALSYSTTVDAGSVVSASYVTVNPSPDLAFPSNQSFSVSMWVQIPSNAIPGDLPFFGNATGSANSPGFVFAPSYKLGGWQWTLNDGTVNLGVEGGDNSINDGKWHHLLFAFDRTTGYARSYLDGADVDETALGGLGTIERPDPVAIGQDPTGTYAEAGSASIDDVGVWRRALSSYEAYAIYYVGATLGKSFDTPAAPEVRIEIQPISGGIELRWSSGTLESSDRADGGYATVPGATSPHSVVPATGNQFYRIRVQ